VFLPFDPGAGAPSFMLPPLRGLKQFHSRLILGLAPRLYASARFAGSIVFLPFDPGAGAPRLYSRAQIILFASDPGAGAQAYAVARFAGSMSLIGRSKIWTVIQNRVARGAFFFDHESSMTAHHKIFSEYFHSLSNFIHRNINREISLILRS